MKVYVACPYNHRRVAREVQDQITAAGFEATSRWVTRTDPPKFHEPVQDPVTAGHHLAHYRGEHLQAEAHEDLDDVRNCDVIVQVALHGSGGGMNFEAGYGHAYGKRLIVIGQRTNIFQWLGEYVEDTHDAIKLLKRWRSWREEEKWG